MAVNPAVRYWRAGRAVRARALVFAGGGAPSGLGELPPPVRGIVAGLAAGACASGYAFAVLDTTGG